MVAVASGSAAQVERWGDSLRAASIHFEIACCDESINSSPAGYLELWVDQDDVDEARSALRSAVTGDRLLLW